MVILLGYQYALVHSSLAEFIFYSPREGLFNANREGIFSTVGCLALYIICESIAFAIFFQHRPLADAPASVIRRVKMRWLWSTLGLSSFLVCAWVIAETIPPTSRRLFNLAFVLLCIFVGTFGVSSLLFIELLFDSSSCESRPVKILELMSNHQLVVFFFANVLTGLVNITFETIFQNSGRSILIPCCFFLQRKIIGNNK
jgi:phosphatidylinositol glycan class W